MRKFAISIEVEARIIGSVTDDDMRAEIVHAIAEALTRRRADSLNIVTEKRPARTRPSSSSS